jgi:hypothetical protein
MKLSKEGLTKEQWRHLKRHGVLPPTEIVQPIIQESVVTDANTASITILCVRFGRKYGVDYVERLRNMVARHMSVPYEFVCLTDDPNPIPGVRLIYQRAAGYSKLWWHKVHMFDPNLPLSGRILYLDLDVVVCGDLSRLVSNLTNEFMGIQDFNRKFNPNWKILNSSTMSWEHRSQSHIWDKFVANPSHAQRLHGDQDWIWQCAKDKIKFWPWELIQSYKWEIRNRDELVDRTGKKGFKFISRSNPKLECCVAVFHGDPKPESVPDPFVVDNWR